MAEYQTFDEIYTEYRDYVFRIAYMITNNTAASEDIAQDVFLTLYVIMRKGVKLYSVKGWLSYVAKNDALSYLRKGCVKDVPLTLDEETSVALGLISPSCEDEYIRNWSNEQRVAFHRHVMAGLLAKNPRWYQAVMIETTMNISQKAAATRMKMTVNAYEVMLYRARKWMIKVYGVEYEELKKY